MVNSMPVRNYLNEDKIKQFMDIHIKVAITQKEKQPLQ